MNSFNENYKMFLSAFGSGRKMVLSTAENNIVSSRMMSVVQIDGTFYFQTDINFRKYRQLTKNPNVALCIDNIQIEGEAAELGRPLENAPFCETFEKSFKGSYDAYTNSKPFYRQGRQIEFCQSRKATAAMLDALQESLTQSDEIIAVVSVYRLV